MRSLKFLVLAVAGMAELSLVAAQDATSTAASSTASDGKAVTVSVGTTVSGNGEF